MVTKFTVFETFSPIFYVKILENIPVFYYTIIYRVFSVVFNIKKDRKLILSFSIYSFYTKTDCINII